MCCTASHIDLYTWCCSSLCLYCDRTLTFFRASNTHRFERRETLLESGKPTQRSVHRYPCAQSVGSVKFVGSAWNAFRIVASVLSIMAALYHEHWGRSCSSYPLHRGYMVPTKDHRDIWPYIQSSSTPYAPTWYHKLMHSAANSKYSSDEELRRAAMEGAYVLDEEERQSRVDARKVVLALFDF